MAEAIERTDPNEEATATAAEEMDEEQLQLKPFMDMSSLGTVEVSVRAGWLNVEDQSIHRLHVRYVGHISEAMTAMQLAYAWYISVLDQLLSDEG